MNAAKGAALLLVAVLVGCGSGQIPTHPVNGKVVFSDGSHPMFGTVEFYNEEHRINARGKIDRNGTFTVTTYEPDDGAVAGDHKIVIIQIVSEPTSQFAKAKAPFVHNHGDIVSTKYLDYRTSDLSCSIDEGENEVVLTVEKSTKE